MGGIYTAGIGIVNGRGTVHPVGKEMNHKVTKKSKSEALAKLDIAVTPAKAGVQNILKRLDSGFRRNDDDGLLQEAQSNSSFSKTADPRGRLRCREVRMR